MCLCVFVSVISLGGNLIGDEGASAIGDGLHGLPSLTSLEYVMQAWVMCMMGRGLVEWCDGECAQVCVCGVGDVCDGERTGGVV